MVMKLQVLALGVAFLCAISLGEKFSGSINLVEEEGFAFLGKFCFQDLAADNFTDNLLHGPAAGIVNVELTNTGSVQSRPLLYFFDDQPNSWPMIYETGLNCSEKTSSSNKYYRLRESVSLEADGTSYHTANIHQHFRPRWWWVYLANCAAYEDAQAKHNLSVIEFELHFTQNTTQWLKKEVGANDFGLNILYSVFLAVYLAMFGVQLYAYYVYYVQQYIHQVIKLLTCVIGLQLFSTVCCFADWMILTETGKHEVFVPIVGALFEITASTIFLLLLLVLSQGWTVSRFEVRRPRLLLAGCCCIAVIQCVSYIWTLVFLDEQSTTYRYNTVPQYIYASLFALLGAVFLFQCVNSYRTEPLASKRTLYIMLAAFFAVYFVWPLLSIFIGDAFSPWLRDIAITSISVTVKTIIYLMMMLMMYPKWAHQYFNLSMVASQQRILNDGGDEQSADASGNPSPQEYRVLDQDRL